MRRKEGKERRKVEERKEKGLGRRKEKGEILREEDVKVKVEEKSTAIDGRGGEEEEGKLRNNAAVKCMANRKIRRWRKGG